MDCGRCSLLRAALLIVSVAALGLPAYADRNLLLTLSSKPDVCVNRPPEPAWMQDIGIREAYERVLVQDIYRTQNLERIVATGSCSCGNRFPSWMAAESEFRERFATAERWEMLEASNTYNRHANGLRPAAMAICKAENNW